MRIWICIPVFNRIEYTMKCLKSLQAQTYRDYRIIVCDHGSIDGTSEKIREKFPDSILLQESPSLWWTGATNRCIEYAMNAADSEDDAILTLNNDLEVEEDYLYELVKTFKQHPDTVVTSAGYDIRTRKLVAPGLEQNWLTSKVKLLDPETDHLDYDEGLANVTHAPGRGTLIPLRAFKELGLFDERHLPHYGADYDFSFRARRAGYKILICYRAKVFSHVEATGLTGVRNTFSWSAFGRYLTNIKSPANISARWWLAVKNCPRLLLPSFLLLDFAFVVGSYFKFHLRNKMRRGSEA